VPAESGICNAECGVNKAHLSRRTSFYGLRRVVKERDVETPRVNARCVYVETFGHVS
jgi:hypothetical protein